VLITPLLLGLLLSAWFWLPALAETRYVQLEAQTTGYFFYGNHFRGGDIIQWCPLFSYEVGSDHSSPFAMGAVQATLALIGGCVVINNLVRRRHTSDDAGGLPTSPLKTGNTGLGRLSSGFAVLGLLLSTWLITPLSRPLWEHVPLLALVQFPWRFLSVQALFTALLAGVVVPPLRRRGGHAVAWILAAVLGTLLVMTSLLGLRPEYLAIGAEEVTDERLQLYELFTGNIGSTIRHEYLPRWVKPRPYAGPSHIIPDAPPRAIPVSGRLSSAQRVEHKPTRRTWEVVAGSAGSEVAFPILYWPGWRATVDGTPVEVRATPDSGYLSAEVPAGRHVVEIWLGRTPLRLGAEAVSLVTALTVLVVSISTRRRPTMPSGGQLDPQRWRPESKAYLRLAICGLPFVVGLVLLLALHSRVTVAASRDLTMDFERMPYLHHNPNGVAFDGWRMVAYTASAEHVAPGETLHVTFDWESKEDGLGDHALDGVPALRLVPPAAVRQDTIPPVVEASLGLGRGQASGAGRTTVDLVIPSTAAPGLHFLEIEDVPRTYLRPTWIVGGETAGDRTITAAFADSKIRLHAIQATQTTPERLDVQLEWSAAAPVAANYGLSLSLTDTAGNEWLHEGGMPGYDTQPGRGFLATSLWPVQRVIADRHTPGLQPGAPPGDQYTLTVELYRVATWESVGEHTVAVSLTEATRRPDSAVVAQLVDDVALSQVDAPTEIRQGEVLRATAYWLAVHEPSTDYVAEWRLQMPGEEITAFAVTQPLSPGSSPTGWPVGAWVAGHVAVSVPPTAPAGTYTLSLTLRDPVSSTELGTYALPEAVRVMERERVWEVPAIEQRSGAQFGGMIELVGYDLAHNGDSLELTLHWRALSTPDRHYMLFVHLADPDTGRPVEQVDTMPQGFTYPTGMWAPAEIISDEVTLSLEEVPSGRYDLAVGWYDPDTRQRLRAVDGQGNQLTDDRLLLSGGVTLP
ncbi:MAG: hypothetical protein PVI63_07905, partial [Anaerolineae bacterium]|jgi:hypothetical protein